MNGPMGGGGYTPEQLQALMEYASSQGAFDEQDRAVQQQMQMANALRNRPMDQYRTGAGAALGGMGNVVNQFLGSRGVTRAQQRDTALQQERIKALRELAAQYRPQQQPMMPSPYGLPDPGAG